jgi:hypothetical protein
MLFGRNSYETNATIWPERTEHPWAERLNSMPKYLFSSTREQTAWSNTKLLPGDVVDELTKLKEQDAATS